MNIKLIAGLCSAANADGAIRQKLWQQIKSKEDLQLQSNLTLEKRLEELTKNGLKAITPLDSGYPKRFLRLTTPPLVVFYLGQIDFTDNFPTVGIIGSRSASVDGIKVARMLGKQLTEMDVLVISGLALGIDGAAQQGAVDANTGHSTICVLGNGLPSIYPNTNAQLAKDILASGGGILSHFAPGTPPYPNNFLVRNELVAALSDLVLVVEAAERSGALSTVNHALSMGKEIAAVPSNILNPRAKGSNLLLQAGAHPILSAHDILNILQIKPKKPSALTVTATNSTSSHPILKLLQSGDTDITTLANKLNISLSSARAVINELELSGNLKILPGEVVTVCL